MNTKTLTAIALLLAAVPVASFAQEAATPAPSTMPARPTPPVFDFAAADTDGSGGISVEEWTAYAGTLRDARRAEMTGARADALMAAADANGDGMLTRDELVTGMETLGAQMRTQFAEGRGMMGERFAMRHHGDEGRGDRHEGRGEMRRGGHHGERGGEQARDGGEGRMRDMPGGMGRGMDRGDRASFGFNRIDADGDGQISAEELGHAQEMVNWMASRPQRG